MIWSVILTEVDLTAEQVTQLAADLVTTVRQQAPGARVFTTEGWRFEEKRRPPEQPLLVPSTQRRHTPEHEHRTPSRRKGAQADG